MKMVLDNLDDHVFIIAEKSITLKLYLFEIISTIEIKYKDVYFFNNKKSIL